MRQPDDEDISALAGLNQRSPLLAGDDDAGDGFAGRHSAAGGFLRQISAAEIRDRSRRRPRATTAITASCSRRWRAW